MFPIIVLAGDEAREWIHHARDMRRLSEHAVASASRLTAIAPQLEKLGDNSNDDKPQANKEK